MNVDRFTAGDSVDWTVVDNDHPAPDWVISYAFSNAAGKTFSVTGTGAGETHSFSLGIAESAGIDAGQWFWQRYATNATLSKRVTTANGSVMVRPNLEAGPADLRSDARTALDNIKRVIAAVTANDVSSLSIKDRSMARRPFTELIQMKAALEREVEREETAAGIAKAAGRGNKVFVRLGR